MNPLFDLEPHFLALYDQCAAETMTSPERIYAVWQSVRYVVSNHIPGDFVECGVWRGGSTMMAALTFLFCAAGSRPLWLYDTFEGVSPPGEVDVEAISGRPAATILNAEPRHEGRNTWSIAGRQIVEANMAATGYPRHLLRFVEGRVEETLRTTRPEAISILRLDTDWYESTRLELEELWPLLSPGGVLIVDDYGWWRGARKAVDDYFAAMDFVPLMSRLDLRVGSW